MKDLKRDELPSFLELPYTFDIYKILKTVEKSPEGYILNNLYKKLQKKYPKNLKTTFGFSNESDDETAPALYKLMNLTEYDSTVSSRDFAVRIPKNRLDERQYNKLKPWVIGTYLEEVISTFKGHVTRVRVARMEPGCVIDEHIDYNTNYSIRVHVPLITNDQCGFYVNRGNGFKKDYMTMPADGRCWFINPGHKHSAWNRGNTPRDHLVLSIVGQDDLFQ